MKHLLSLESLSKAEIESIIGETEEIKRTRGAAGSGPLAGQIWSLMFSKASTRTRVSFEIGIRELGGSTFFLSAQDIQLGRGEPIKDTARVMGRMIDGAVIRTFGQSDVETFSEYAGVPTINALTDDEHPCQILSDLFTFDEKRGPIAGKTVTFVGDGGCNVARSWVFAGLRLGFEVRIAAPTDFFPAEELMARLKEAATNWEWKGEEITATFPSGGRLWCTPDLQAAVRNTDLLYTDVWVSMGKESESEERIRILKDYQINEALIRQVGSDPLVMHCLPAYRGKEIDEATFEAHAQTIFDEAENRLHTQKTILKRLARGGVRE